MRRINIKRPYPSRGLKLMRKTEEILCQIFNVLLDSVDGVDEWGYLVSLFSLTQST